MLHRLQFAKNFGRHRRREGPSFVPKFTVFFLILQFKTYQLQDNSDNMTKADIVNEIARTTGTDRAAVLSVVEQFMTVVKDSLAHGENVYLRGFGSFIIKTRAEKTARNISKNTSLIIPAHNIPAFKPANSFKEEVAK